MANLGHDEQRSQDPRRDEGKVARPSVVDDKALRMDHEDAVLLPVNLDGSVPGQPSNLLGCAGLRGPGAGSQIFMGEDAALVGDPPCSPPEGTTDPGFGTVVESVADLAPSSWRQPRSSRRSRMAAA